MAVRRTFFTADTHFGDSHILRQRGGRYPTIEAHDQALIARWNEAVGPNDDVWHVGDFASGASRDHCRAVFDALAGRKHLVRGNHDTNRVLELPWATPPVESVRVTVADETGLEHRLHLAHYPHRSWPGLWRGTRHLYGHTHARIADTRRSCDIGVDAWEDRPAALEDIIARQDRATVWPEELADQAARGLLRTR